MAVGRTIGPNRNTWKFLHLPKPWVAPTTVGMELKTPGQALGLSL